MGLPTEDTASTQLLNQLLNDTSSARNTRVHNWIEEQYDFALTEHAAAEADSGDNWTLDEDDEDDASQFSFHESRVPSPVPSSTIGANRAFSLSIDRPDSPVIPEHAARLDAEADADALQGDVKTPTADKKHLPRSRSRKEPAPSYDDLFFPSTGRQLTEEETLFEDERNRALRFLVKEMAGWGLDVGNRAPQRSTCKSPRTPKKSLQERGRRPPPPTPRRDQPSSTSDSPRLVPRMPSFTHSAATSSPSTVPTALVEGHSAPPSNRTSAQANKPSECPEQSGEHIGLAPAAVSTQKPRRPRASSDVLGHHHGQATSHFRVPTSGSGEFAKSGSRSPRQSLTFAANIALPLSPTLSTASGSGFERMARESLSLDEVAAQHATGPKFPYEESSAAATATGGAPASPGPIPRLAVPQLEEPQSRWSAASSLDVKGAQQQQQQQEQQQRPPSPTKSSFLGRMTPKRERAHTYTSSRSAIDEAEGGDGRDALGVPGQAPQKRSRLMSLLAKLSPRPDLPSSTQSSDAPPVPALPAQYASMDPRTPEMEKADPFAREKPSPPTKTPGKKASLASLRQSFSMSRASFASNRNPGVVEEEVPPLPRPSISSMIPRTSIGGASLVSGTWVPEDAEVPPMPHSATSGTFVYPPVTSPTLSTPRANAEATPAYEYQALPSPTKSTNTVLTAHASTVNLNSSMPSPSPARSSFDLLVPPQTPSSTTASTPTPTLASMSTPNLTPTPTPTSTSFSHAGLGTPTSGIGYYSGARALGQQGSYVSLASQGSGGSNSGTSRIPSASSLRSAPSKGALAPPAVPVPAVPPKEEKAPNRGLSLFGRKNRAQAKSTITVPQVPPISTTTTPVSAAATVTSPTVSRIGAPATGLPKPRARVPPPPLNLSLASPSSTSALPMRSAIASGPSPPPQSSTMSPGSPPGSSMQILRSPSATETTKSKIGSPTLSKTVSPPSGKYTFASSPTPPSRIALPPPPARLLAVQQQQQRQQQQQYMTQEDDDATSPGPSPLSASPPPVPPKSSQIPNAVPRLTTQRSSPRLQQQQPSQMLTGGSRIGTLHGSRSEASLLSAASATMTRERGLTGTPLKVVDEMGLRIVGAGEKDVERTITTNAGSNANNGGGNGGGKTTMLPVPKKSFWRRG
ncbi:hypothetical protein CONPUDRAFT_168239 [Coniophora puteana RWD-64-598 SS2]|uniref:Uncharacterized protein n=1 Tax=Coniophora puteana (strain RWD-64-598) TaxID=741705 RepID=A0A5M3MDQ8_CONPW|nr:uncharacterized protein CONPUDRAFT_168239 [Coniophora puteana RWD-64-598 SS2]EIW77263.1 hypothetical protein CONPUDRAFT_168239 [Coniophora puteana RWD-64-598 SS2]